MVWSVWFSSSFSFFFNLDLDGFGSLVLGMFDVSGSSAGGFEFCDELVLVTESFRFLLFGLEGFLTVFFLKRM